MLCFHYCVFFKVRYTQLIRQKKWKPSGVTASGLGKIGGLGRGAMGHSRHGGSRRSGYAFAHQEGFGELITSGKNMRLSSLALATSWIDSLRKKKLSTTASAQSTSSEQTNADPVLSNSVSTVQFCSDTVAQDEMEATV